MRFALIETKIKLSSFLKINRFSVDKKTIGPVEIDPYSFILTARGDIKLDVEKILISCCCNIR